LKVTLSTAVRSPNFLVRFSASIMLSRHSSASFSCRRSIFVLSSFTSWGNPTEVCMHVHMELVWRFLHRISLRHGELNLASTSYVAWSAAFVLNAGGRLEVGSSRPPGSARDARACIARGARSARSEGGSRNRYALSAELNWLRSHTSRVLNTGIRSEGEEFWWSCAFSAGRGSAVHRRSRLITPWR